jgi:hypothetical protein
MASLAGLDAQEALRRFELGSHTDRLANDESTGKQYRLMIYASTQPWDEAEIAVTVSVTAEPRIVRRARRFKFIAEFWEGWRDSGSAAWSPMSCRWLGRILASRSRGRGRSAPRASCQGNKRSGRNEGNDRRPARRRGHRGQQSTARTEGNDKNRRQTTTRDPDHSKSD